MGIDHVLNRISDNLARRQTVDHSVMTHRNAIVHGDRVEFLRDPTSGFNLTADQLTQIFEMNVSGDKLGKGIGNCNDGFLKILGLHSGGAPERTSTRHIASLSRGFGSINWHSASDSAKGS
jgi:hypothetical protein